MLYLSDSYGQFIGFSFIIIGFIIGSYSIDFNEVANYRNGFLLSCLTVIITISVTVLLREKVFLTFSTITFYPIAAVTHRLTMVLVKVVFSIPVKPSI